MSLDIRYIISPYVEPGTDFEGAIQEIEQLINQERRAAAEAMRERCTTLELKGPAEGNPDLYVLGWMNCQLLYQSAIKDLPLDSDGGQDAILL